MNLKKWILLAVFLLSLLIIGAKFLMNTTIGNQIILKDYKEIATNNEELNVIFHGKQIDSDRIQQLIDILPSIQLEQQKFFPNFSLDDELNVYIIYQDESTILPFFKESEEYENVAYYNLSNESIYLNGESDSLIDLFVHEYMHYYMHQFTKSVNVNSARLPIWFVEGLANSFEVNVTNTLPISIGSFEVMPFGDLNKPTDANLNTIYAQGMYGILSLIENQGAGIIQTILTDAQDNSFNKAFTNATSIDLTTYHQSFVHDEEMLKQLYDGIYTHPHLVIEEVENLLSYYGRINIYGTSLFELLFEAHYSLNNEKEIIYYAELLMKSIDSPLYLIGYAKRISPISKTLADEMLELAFSKATSPEEELRLKEYAKEI